MIRKTQLIKCRELAKTISISNASESLENKIIFSFTGRSGA